MSETTGLNQYIAETYPEYDSDQIVADNYEPINKAEMFFEELNDVYEGREKYNLHWAYKQASNSFDNVSEVITAATKIKGDQDGITIEMRQVLNKEIKKASRRYSLLSRTTLFLDIFISVILILAVTLIAQYVESSLESVLYTILFIGFIALVKVSLDRFVIIPRIEKWGWNKYWQLTTLVSAKLMQMLAMKLVLKTARKQQETSVKIMELITRSEEIFYTRRPLSLISRRDFVPIDSFANRFSSVVSSINLED